MLAPADRAVWVLARRRLFVPVDVVLVAITLVCAAGVPIPAAVQIIPFALGLVLFGLPHGALDHLVPARLAGRPASLRTVGPVVHLYLVLGGLVLGLWTVAPVAASVFFIALTWFHWGTGDAHAVSARGRRLSGSRVVTVPLLRGALPMIVPLLAFPETYGGVLASTTRAFGVGAPPGAVSGPVRIGLAAGLGVLVAAVVLAEYRAHGQTPDGRRSLLGDLGEVTLLIAFFSVVPPVLAVGLYFSLWHSLRHIVRLSLIDAALAGPALENRWGAVLARFSLQAAPITLAALALLVGLFVALSPRAGGSPSALLGIYLVLISALTLPHAVVVGAMDRARR
ncbi:Brp/Blh family beta-carotene 15,15'-dioxygenase [Frondihabitans peucedani]|uniref:Probable beta-carotene 15,15'-dioxygenase n=1 Tax=Frondihabitans peucedani TaxID=598626 RepID=A0ABP8E688_9MICO